MANYCYACKTYIQGFEMAHVLSEALPDYVLCDLCHKDLVRLNDSQADETIASAKSRFVPLLLSEETPELIKEVLRKNITLHKAETARIAFDEALANMILTTGSSFEGYRIVKYIDIVSSEVFFKNSFANTLEANIDDFFSSLNFHEHEYTGVSKLINRAKQYVMQKFRIEAADMGANAVLGINFETSLDSEIVKVSINGTAVFVEKNS